LLGEAGTEVLAEGTALADVAGLGAEPGVEVDLGTATGLELELGLGEAGVLGLGEADVIGLGAADVLGLLLPPAGAAMAGKLESSLRLQPVRATSSAGHCTWRKVKFGLSAFLNQSNRQ
jgi:hypothetical protein